MFIYYLASGQDILDGVAQQGFTMLERAVTQITDGDSWGYRGNIFYNLLKTPIIRLAFAIA
jgi:hypothetical protein